MRSKRRRRRSSAPSKYSTVAWFLSLVLVLLKNLSLMPPFRNPKAGPKKAAPSTKRPRGG
jgi:hypothetical protein